MIEILYQLLIFVHVASGFGALWLWVLPTFILTPFIIISLRRYAR
jgi:hypothetical protein